MSIDTQCHFADENQLKSQFLRLCLVQLQVAITSTPSIEDIKIQIQSLGRADIQNHLTSAFIEVFCVLLHLK